MASGIPHPNDMFMLLQRSTDAVVNTTMESNATGRIGGAQLGMDENARRRFAMRVSHSKAATAMPILRQCSHAYRPHVRMQDERVHNVLLGSGMVHVGPASRQLWGTSDKRDGVAAHPPL